MAIVVFIYFRTIVPSAAIVLAVGAAGDRLVQAPHKPTQVTEPLPVESDAARGFTPPPATVSVSLADGETAALGTITLQHVHERDISPAPNAEAGTMAVAVAEGLRLVDTQTNTLIEVAPGHVVAEHDPYEGIEGLRAKEAEPA